MNEHIDVIATTISGSIKDWGKVKRIVPLFKEHDYTDVSLFELDRHSEARKKTCEIVRAGGRLIISAGGSGTFNSVLEGCCDSGISLKEIRLGFLRKGSADLIGKTLGMPDEIEAAINVFADSIRKNYVLPCDVLSASSEKGNVPVRRFVGYGGAEIFGDIPHFTENRYMKYYKGILSQLFGDLGPFFVGTNLAVLSRLPRRWAGKAREWQIIVDDQVVSGGRFQVIIIVNGDLGPNLPFARNEPLGSGSFYLFVIRDMGTLNLYRQMKHAFKTSVQDDPERWGFESFKINKSLVLKPDDENVFPVNVDGSTLDCLGSARFEIVDQIRLISSGISTDA